MKMNGNYFEIRRKRDAMGERGHILCPVDFEKKEIRDGSNGEIIIGCGLFISNSRTWWRTTVVEEIISVNEDNTEIVVRTSNSQYLIKSYDRSEN